MGRRLSYPRGSSLLLAGIIWSYGCDCPVTVRSFQASSRYVCSGETVSFNWSINCVDKYKFDTGNGMHLATLGKHATSYVTPAVQANWDFIQMTGCQGSACESRLFDIQIIDNPKWTRSYFYDRESGLQLIGDPPQVDPNPLPEYQGAMYGVYRMISGYSYTIPQTDYSARARVLQVGYDGVDNGLFQVQVSGMFVEAQGAHIVSRTWVIKGQMLAVATPFHPSEATWILSYDQPRKILVALSDKPTIDKRDNPQITETSVGLYPSIKFYVKCQEAPPPSP
jgi:hypothetical protein